MKIIRSNHQIRELLKYHRLQNKKIAFVPTMGALHEGHISLIKKARSLADIVVVSIFVNKAQFNNDEDFTKYPRNIEQDILKLTNCKYGVDYVFTPDDCEIFPINSRFKITPLAFADCLCGLSRGNHFEGVALIIIKLFNIIQPDFAIFGEKDFQQLFLIKEMAARLHPEIQIIAAPTIRDTSGLALSSRNVRLTSQGLESAEIISKVLRAASSESSLTSARHALKQIEKNGSFTLDYAEIIDEESFQVADESSLKTRVIIAGWIEGVRLIDNMAMQNSLVGA